MSFDGELAIGPACAEDLSTIVELHLAQLPCPDTVLTCLGRAVVACAYRWFASDERAALLVARKAGEVAGFTSLAEGSYVRALVRRCPLALATGLLTHPGALAHEEMRERIAGLIGRGPGGAGPRSAGPGGRWAQVAFTVVTPQARGQGVSGLLKEAGADAARAWGWTAW